jgi:predicted PurR-regulated permease PerM
VVAKRPTPGTAPVAEIAVVAAEPPRSAPKLTAIEIALMIVAVLAVIAAARVAEPFLVPVVAGILLSYALRPVVSKLEDWRVPRTVAAALVIVVLGAGVSAAGYSIRNEFNAAVAELPGAARKLRIAVTESARGSPGAMTHVKEAAAELDRAAAEATGKPAAPVARTPVEGVAMQFQTFVTQQSGMALAVLSEVVLAVLLAFFLLAAGDTFRRKVAHLAGESLARRRVTIEVLNEIDTQIQWYLLTLLFTNVLIALATWGALVLLGLPNAGMWGALTGLLHAIPYAGTVIAAAGIGLATFVDSGSLPQALVAMGVVFTIAMILGVGFMTWLQGRAAHMNPVAVFIGVLFFGWLWGGWGLLLGLPILAVVKSISDRVDSLHPVSELLGS